MTRWHRRLERWARRWQSFARASLVAIASAAACHSSEGAVTAANVQRDVGVASAAVLHDVCTVGYERAQTEAEIQALDDLGCVKAAHALRTFRQAHALVVAVLVAYDAGRCTSLVNQAPRECDLAGPTLAMVKAAGELAVTLRALEAKR